MLILRWYRNARDRKLVKAFGVARSGGSLRLRSGQAFDFVRLAPHCAQDDKMMMVRGEGFGWPANFFEGH
ncbi:MAG: hypothetical protein DMG83_24385 [Acidobacteria bacterium]|nr:MAG: hypothetical protein DMG83_24385 [Acidobacteriota bacterium]